MFLYRLVRRRRRRRRQLFGFLSFWHDCWPWPLDYLIRFWFILVVTLTLNFLGQLWNLLYLSQKCFDCHETKNKHDWTQGLKCDQRFDIGHDIDLEFSRSNMEFAISQPKMVRLPRNQTYRFNLRPQIWASGLILATTLTFNFQGIKYGICYIPNKSGPLATKRNANILIDFLASNVTNGFDIGHDFDLWIFNVTLTFDHSHGLH